MSSLDPCQRQGSDPGDLKRWFRVLDEEIYGCCVAIKDILLVRGYVVEQTNVSCFMAVPGFPRSRAARGVRIAPGPTAPSSRDACVRHRTAPSCRASMPPTTVAPYVSS